MRSKESWDVHDSAPGSVEVTPEGYLHIIGQPGKVSYVNSPVININDTRDYKVEFRTKVIDSLP